MSLQIYSKQKKNRNGQINLIPVPREINLLQGKYIFDTRSIIWIENNDSEHRFIAEVLNAELQQCFGITLNIALSSDPQIKGARYIYISNLAETGKKHNPLFIEQGYILKIYQDAIYILAPSLRGQFYGVQTLRQLIRTSPGKFVPQLEITDYPALAWRGVSDDISRGQVSTLDDFKRIIEELAFYKMNLYMPYIEDMFRFNTDPDIGRTRGAITKHEMAELVAHAKKYHITLCPVFECLGHQRRILSLIQNRKYAELPEPEKTPWSFSPVSPAAFNFVTKLIDEIVLATPGVDFFHIGCDESYDVGLGTSKQAVNKIGIGRVHAEYFSRLHDYLRDRHHRRTILYGDMLLKHPEAIPYLPKDCIIMDWQYEPADTYPSVKKFINAGFTDILVSPSVRSDICFYPDNYLGFINIRKLTAVAKKEKLLGSVVSAWGDHGAENLRENNYLGYAYHASASWEPKPAENQTEFIQRFVKLYYNIENPQRLALAEELLGFLPGYPVKSLFGIFHSQFNLREQEINLVKMMQRLRKRIIPVLPIISQQRSKVRLHREHLESIEHSAKRYLYLAERIILQDKISKKFKRITSGTLPLAEQRTIATALISLRNQLVEIYSEYCRLWLRNNKYPELEVNLNRLQLQISQLQDYITKSIAGELQAPKPMEAVWMWYPQGEPTSITEMGTYYFVRPITILKKDEIKSAELIVWADDYGKVFLNGQELFTVTFRDIPKQISVQELLKPDLNILAIEAVNALPTYAGLVLELRIEYSNGRKEMITGDKHWRVTDRRISGWYNHVPSAREKHWVPVKLLGKGFISPWKTKIDWY
ncbi:MAG: beta-N-acetylhexosaminidase [bacterium]|nr:beta-N-acetylhexosaminidase [bacterium]